VVYRGSTPVDDKRKRELRLIRGWLRRPPKTFAARMAFHHLKRKHGFSPSPVTILMWY
jgi:hypothetical protein